MHTINLENFKDILTEVAELAEREVRNKPMKALIEFQLKQACLRLGELQENKIRKSRSINWIGSAWKWVAGSPDATDWDNILRSQNELVNNNNNQYLINHKLFNATQEAVMRVNSMITHVNAIDKGINAESSEMLISNKILIIKEQISEIVRASQMAKTGIVDTNLLDRAEIERVISEEEGLPYQNLVEALEYATPSIYSNGTLLLYILSVPKVKPDRYQLLLARAATSKARRVNLQYQRLLVNKYETYGITSDCSSINNSTICEMRSLKKLPEDGCLARLLKGGDARCHFEPSNDVVIELVEANTLFLTNFLGTVRSENQSTTLNGTFLIQIHNETIFVGNQSFTSTEARSLQALPSVLTNVTSEGLKLNLEYIHDLSLRNIDQLSKLGQNFHFSLAIDAVFLSILAMVCYSIWKKITMKIELPKVHQPTVQPRSLQKPTINLRDADI